MKKGLADRMSEVALAGIAAGWRPEEIAAALVELADNAMMAVLATRDVERDFACLKKS